MFLLKTMKTHLENPTQAAIEQEMCRMCIFHVTYQYIKIQETLHKNYTFYTVSKKVLYFQRLQVTQKYL